MKPKQAIVQSAGAVEYTDCRGVNPPPCNKCPGYDTKQPDGEIPALLGNAEYPFIAITPRSTLARSGSTW